MNELFDETTVPMTWQEQDDLRQETEKFRVHFPKEIHLCHSCMKDRRTYLNPSTSENKREPLSFDMVIAKTVILPHKDGECFLCSYPEIPCPECDTTTGFGIECPRCERVGCYTCMPEGVGILCPECLAEIEKN